MTVLLTGHSFHVIKLDLTPGVRGTEGTLITADQAARRVADLAETAARAGTFGIGGLLMDRRGRIYAEAVNSVIRNGAVCDPTAHAERQLVDWYFARSGTGALPPPGEMVIVSSLDPCAMCAGAILKSGFAAIAVAEDVMSGVHEHGQPHRMPRSIWAEAEARLALFPVGGRKVQPFHVRGLALDGEISEEAAFRCEAAFAQSLNGIRALVAGAKEDQAASPSRAGPAEPPSGAWVPDWPAASVTGTSREQLIHAPSPGLDPFTAVDGGMGRDCGPALTWARSLDVSTSRFTDMNLLLAEDRSCLIDSHGRPIFIAETAEALSPARSSVLELIRAYVSFRLRAQGWCGPVPPHPRTCSVLKYRASASPEQALLELGALGSFLEAPRLPNPFPLLAYLEDDEGRAPEFAAALPPLYTQVIGVTTGPLRPQRHPPASRADRTG